ncbi:MAG: hypothetical protein O3A92_15850, partial [Verrucomicrobia bacterium]|nr:hypothetical protein [Verrucomicrobiota bacterium]
MIGTPPFFPSNQRAPLRAGPLLTTMAIAIFLTSFLSASTMQTPSSSPLHLPLRPITTPTPSSCPTQIIPPRGKATQSPPLSPSHSLETIEAHPRVHSYHHQARP